MARSAAPVRSVDDLRHPARVANLAAELHVAALQIAGQRQRTADGVAGGAGVQPGEVAEHGHGAHLAGPEGLQRVAQQGIMETLRELGDGELAPASHRQEPGEHDRSQASHVPGAHQLARRRVGRQVGARQSPGVIEQSPDRGGIVGGDLAEVRFEAVEVAPEGHATAIPALELGPDVEIDDLPVRKQAHFAPEPVHARSGRRADQPVDAVVDRVALPLPGRHQPARQRVHLVDAGAVAVHLRVAAGAESGDAAADDGDGLARLA